MHGFIQKANIYIGYSYTAGRKIRGILKDMKKRISWKPLGLWTTDKLAEWESVKTHGKLYASCLVCVLAYRSNIIIKSESEDDQTGWTKIDYGVHYCNHDVLEYKFKNTTVTMFNSAPPGASKAGRCLTRDWTWSLYPNGYGRPGSRSFRKGCYLVLHSRYLAPHLKQMNTVFEISKNKDYKFEFNMVSVRFSNKTSPRLKLFANEQDKHVWQFGDCLTIRIKIPSVIRVGETSPTLVLLKNDPHEIRKEPKTKKLSSSSWGYFSRQILAISPFTKYKLKKTNVCFFVHGLKWFFTSYIYIYIYIYIAKAMENTGYSDGKC